MHISSYRADNLKLAMMEKFTPKQLARATVRALFLDTLGWNMAICVVTSPAGDSDTHSSGQWAGHA